MKYLFYFLVLLHFNNTSSQITYNYTGAMQSYTVPLGVFEITVDMVGASGGTSVGLGVINTPGLGGRVETTLSVTPGDVLYLFVGGQGQDGDPTSIVAGGWNGGGDSGHAFGQYAGGSGGGASDIRLNSTALADRVIVAGAGGGSATNSYAGGDNGGDGGDLIADNGTSVNILPTLFGYGGTQVAGGAFGFYAPYLPGTAGLLGIGGNAGPDSGGGGGGGGYYGGGGGCWGGGGGGSSFVNPIITTSTTHTKGFNTGNGEITITPHSVLPISLIDFKATIIGNETQLSWSTYSEINNDYFSIERSSNGKDLWETIGTVKGSGNSSLILNYSILDASPLLGSNYYRLVQTNFNGKKEYIATVHVTYFSNVKANIYPNPAKNKITVFFQNEKNQNDVLIFNLMGENVTDLVIIKSTSNNKFNIDISNLPVGNYVVKVKNKNFKFVKVE